MRYKIKELRRKNGDTLKKLAEKINYDYSNLSKIERGVYEPSVSLLRRISDVYGVQISHFLNKNPKEAGFMDNLDISTDEFLKKYNLVLDGKKVNRWELEFTIEIIRKFRAAIHEREHQN